MIPVIPLFVCVMAVVVTWSLLNCSTKKDAPPTVAPQGMPSPASPSSPLMATPTPATPRSGTKLSGEGDLDKAKKTVSMEELDPNKAKSTEKNDEEEQQTKVSREKKTKKSAEAAKSNEKKLRKSTSNKGGMESSMDTCTGIPGAFPEDVIISPYEKFGPPSTKPLSNEMATENTQEAMSKRPPKKQQKTNSLRLRRY